MAKYLKSIFLIGNIVVERYSSNIQSKEVCFAHTDVKSRLAFTASSGAIMEVVFEHSIKIVSFSAGGDGEYQRESEGDGGDGEISKPVGPVPRTSPILSGQYTKLLLITNNINLSVSSCVPP